MKTGPLFFINFDFGRIIFEDNGESGLDIIIFNLHRLPMSDRFHPSGVPFNRVLDSNGLQLTFS